MVFGKRNGDVTSVGRTVLSEMAASGARKPEAPQRVPIMDREAFRREVVRVSAVSDFESDPAAFADTLWPLVNRLLEDAWDLGSVREHGQENPYGM